MVARFVMKSNKKRILLVLAILTMAILLSFVFVACDKAGTNKTGTDIAADYKVTIHPNNGQSDIVWDITKEIPTITKDGYHIAGYFLDAQLTIGTTLESLKTTGLSKNIDVYVKWEEDVCEHVEVIDAAVEPTCTEKGLTEGKHCSKCGKILTAQTEIDALGHDLENHAGQPATCTEIGWESYDTCKREGCNYTTYKVIPAHHELVHHNAKSATCTDIGWEAYDTCSQCDYTTYKEIAALGHNYNDVVTVPTCTEQGYTTHTCTRCEHNYKDTYVTALGHKEVIDNAVEPTCTTSGWTEGSHCSVCGEVLQAKTEIDALGHDLEYHEGKTSTCTESGWKEYYTCKREGCDYSTYEKIPAGHKFFTRMVL